MAIDSQPGAQSLAPEDLGPIENEVPAYRALSKLSVVSLVLGISAILTFTDLDFAFLGVAAIVCGVLAQRRIRKLPDVLTGEKLSNAGIGLALAFVLGAWTVSFMQGWIVRHEAGKFAEVYLKAMNTGSLDAMLYYQATPDGRRTETPKSIHKQLLSGERQSREFEMANPGVIKLAELLKEKGKITITYEGIDRQAMNGLQANASAVYKISGLPTAEFPGGTSYIQVMFQGSQNKTNAYEWWVQVVRFPFDPKAK